MNSSAWPHWAVSQYSTTNGALAPAGGACAPAVDAAASNSARTLIGASSSGFQLLEVFASQLGHLRRDHGAAIGLVRVALVVLLMIVLCRIERCERDDLRDD